MKEQGESGGVLSKTPRPEGRTFDSRRMVTHDNNILRLFIILAAVFGVMSFLRPALFLKIDNFESMAFQFPEFGVLSIAIMLTMLTGGIDLSVVGIANLSGILSILFLKRIVPDGAPVDYAAAMIVVAVVAAMVIGMFCGLFNGFIVSKIGIPPILATLGSMQLFTGVALVVTRGYTVTQIPTLFSDIGNASVGGVIPVSLIIYAIAALIIGFILSKTSFGLRLYMMGTNAVAARFSGVNNAVVTILTYITSGILSSIAGLVMIARINSARADFGTPYTLQAVLISVLGGVNPNGGFGTVGGITLAVLILQFLSSGFNMFESISNFVKDLVWGLVLIVMLVLNYYINRRRDRA